MEIIDKSSNIRLVHLIAIGLVFMMLVGQAAGAWPRCYSGCTASNIIVNGVYIKNVGTCSGTTQTAQLWGNFNVNTNQADCVVVVYNSSYSYDGTTWTQFETNKVVTFDHLNSGPLNIQLSTITFPCGADLRISDIYIQWKNQPQGCAYNCGPYVSSQCWMGGPLNVQQPGIKIVKVVETPCTGPQSFAFSLNGNPVYTFTSCSGGIYNLNQLTIGTYTVSETVPTNWVLTSATCDLPGGCTRTGDSLSVTLTDANQHATVTFTDTPKGRIKVDKVTSPAADPTPFTFHGSWDLSGTDFQLKDTDSPYVSGYLVPGNDYVVCEPASSLPAGWALTGISTDAISKQFGDGTNWHSTFTAGDTCVKIALQKGEEPTVTFTNTKQGKITIDKVTTPSGDSRLFDFTRSWTAGTLQLADGTTPYESNYLMPGVYTICETNLPADWALSGIGVTGTGVTYQFGDGTNWHPAFADGDTCVQITLGAGQTAAVTFTDTKKGKITIDKVTNPSGDSQLFDFTRSWISGTLQLADGTAPYESDYLMPGVYTICENNLPTNWALSSIGVSGTGVTYQFGDGTNWHPAFADGDTCVQITLGAGQTAAVTFTDTKKSKITLDKVTNPSGDSQLFDFTRSWTAGILKLADGTAPYESNYLMPGVYTICENNLPADWALTDISGTGSGVTYQFGDGLNWHSTFTFGDTCVQITLGAGQTAAVVYTDKRCQTANAGGDTYACEGQPIVLTGISNPYATSVRWDIKDGGGSLIWPYNGDQYQAEYTPPASGIPSPYTAHLTFTAFGPCQNNQCPLPGSVCDEVEVYVVQHPVATISIISP